MFDPNPAWPERLTLGRPARQGGAPANAALIRTCDKLIRVAGDLDALFAIRQTIEDEERTEAELDTLCEARDAVLDRLETLGAVACLAEARAMARAVLALTPAPSEWCDDALWMAGEVVAFVAAAPLPEATVSG